MATGRIRGAVDGAANHTFRQNSAIPNAGAIGCSMDMQAYGSKPPTMRSSTFPFPSRKPKHLSAPLKDT